MLGRDSYPIRLPQAPPASADGAPLRHLQDAAINPTIKAAGLVHRLREARPTMRLVRPEEAPAPTRTVPPALPTPSPKPQARPSSPSITDPADPRWVLALRTAESLQGTILGPEKRERLVKVGKMMGLTAFDANLVIAIVQDQARRGYAPEYCATAGEPQLAMVPLPKRELSDDEARTRRIGIICGVITILVGLEIIILKWLFS